MNRVELVKMLRERESNQTVDLNTIDDRKKAELEFHNRLRGEQAIERKDLPQDVYELLHGNKRFYQTVKASRDYVSRWLATHVPGKVFLDYACGNGEMAIKAAKCGADIVIGIDISDVSVRNARAAAEKAGVGSRCFFIQADCENTLLPEGCIDVAICSGMLHHLDLKFAFPELRRILSNSGVILAVEALEYNPIIKIYRGRTPEMRTDWEKNHILGTKDLQFAKSFFKLGEVRYWHLFSILGAWFYNRKILFAILEPVLNGIDRLFLRIPGVRLMAWQFTFELHKQ